MENKRKIHRPSPVVEEEEEEIKIPVFPQEIVVEILSRLPVKSLCRFRCVSKHWLSLISDPQLAKSHLEQTIANVCLYFKRKRVILSWISLCSLEYESIGRIGGFDENLVALELDYPLKIPNAEALLEDSRKKSGLVRWEIDEETGEDVLHVPFPLVYDIHVFGSCNGLVCISPDPDTLYLFNPSTRESKRIPDSPSGFGPKDRCFYRFGFGCVNDDYKIVKVGYGVFVYSLRADSWRFVCHSPYYGEMHEPGVLLNGAIHWMASHGEEDDDHHQCVIAAFSLEAEVFIDMPSPDIVDYCYEFVVGVLKGCLCVLHIRSEMMHNDIWVMTEYGVAESWTKITLSFSYGSMKPLSVAQNGEALLQVDGKLMLYNFEDGSKRYVVVDGMPKWDFFLQQIPISRPSFLQMLPSDLNSNAMWSVKPDLGTLESRISRLL